MNWSDILDEAKKNLRLRSDYALGKVLGLTDGAIPHYRKGRRSPDANVLWKLAEINNKPFGLYAAMAEEHRAKTAELKEAWRQRIKKSLCLVLTIGTLAFSYGVTEIAKFDKPLPILASNTYTSFSISEGLAQSEEGLTFLHIVSILCLFLALVGLGRTVRFIRRNLRLRTGPTGPGFAKPCSA